MEAPIPFSVLAFALLDETQNGLESPYILMTFAYHLKTKILDFIDHCEQLIAEKNVSA